MTSSPLSLLPKDPTAPLHVPVLSGLALADTDPIAAAIGAARTASTRHVYAYTWGQ